MADLTLAEVHSYGWQGENAKRFLEWRNAVNRHVRNMTKGMDCDDLPDWDYASAFEAGVSPKQAAKEVIEEAFDLYDPGEIWEIFGSL